MSRFNRVLNCTYFGSLVLVFSGFAGGRADSSIEGTLTGSPIPATIFEICARCRESLPPIEHKFDSVGVWKNDSPVMVHEGWSTGQCSSEHGSCSGEICEEDCLAQLADAIAKGGLPTVMAMLQMRPGQLQFNEQRRAIQVMSCDNVPYAHFPLGVAVVAALASAP